MKTTIINLSAVAVILTSSFFAGRIDFTSERTVIGNDNSTQNTEITLSNNNVLTKAIIVDGEVLPVVMLPELIIEAEANPENMVHATLIDGNVMPYVTLPTLTIEAEI